MSIPFQIDREVAEKTSGDPYDVEFLEKFHKNRKKILIFNF